MPHATHVTSSGFVFDRQGQIVVVRARRALVPMAELEFLREVGPRGGRIRDVKSTTGDGRELHLITVDTPAGEQILTFDAGPAFLGHMRRVTERLELLVYGLAAMMAMATVYALLRSIFAAR